MFYPHITYVLGLLVRLLSRLLLDLLRLVHLCTTSTLTTLRPLLPSPARSPRQVAAGKVVLVTTGRQAKTLHTVRALKQIGATVIVTDYEPASASAFSLCCDKFVQLPPLDTSNIPLWIHHFKHVLVSNRVDMVLPVSTINEVLFIALAKHHLHPLLPHIRWVCPDLHTALRLDDRVLFSSLCRTHAVPAPPSGKLTSAHPILPLARHHPHGVIVKRIESSCNRAEEIVHITPKTHALPPHLAPSPSDPWQWQAFVDGPEYSAWYVCLDGRVTLSAAYVSHPDLTHFDPVPIPDALDRSLRRLIRSLNLTGQYAFDYFMGPSGPQVIECNPRASSILETISSTPFWAAAFFGHDLNPHLVKQSVGFIYHRSSWPWTSRRDGHYRFTDPLPFLVAQVIWPLSSLAQHSLLPARPYHHIDVNICKLIRPGPSPARNLPAFRHILSSRHARLLIQAVQCVTTLLMDDSVSAAEDIAAACESAGGRVVRFRARPHAATEGHVEGEEQHDAVVTVRCEEEMDALLAHHMCKETRVLLGADAAEMCGFEPETKYLLPLEGRGGRVRESDVIPLRPIRVLHVAGSSTSKYYEGVSRLYARQCIESLKKRTRLEHMVMYVHEDGRWSVSREGSMTGLGEERMSLGEAVRRVEGWGVDVVQPHLYDYEGMTGFRGMFEAMGVPLVGCSGVAMGLSTNKMMTKMVAMGAGVTVPRSVLVRKGGKVEGIEKPFVVKPVEEDNSQGVGVVKAGMGEEQVRGLVEEGLKFGDVLCEEYIGLGKEVRVGMFENADGSLDMLPVIEYHLSEERPIRTADDKLKTDEGGVPAALARGGRTMDAEIGHELRERLRDMGERAHRALGCRDYSIFDFRVNEQGVPYLLESCLYCSFAPGSVIVGMQKAQGLPEFVGFERLVDRVVTRRRYKRGEGQMVGMKRR